MSKLKWWKTPCAISLLCVAAGTGLTAQTFRTLHNFDSTDGAYPYAAVVQAYDGNLYGTTIFGGMFGFYCGTIFKMTPSGTQTTLHSFCSEGSTADGVYPYAALIQATDGNFYGTAYGGGTIGTGGTVFKITPSGTLTVLNSFDTVSSCPYGEDSSAPLIQGTDGNFYGTTQTCPNYPGGTVFKITPGGIFSTVYDFCSETDCADGVQPYAGLVQGTDGDFYGTTRFGGAGDQLCVVGQSSVGCGTVFKVSRSGTLTVLHSFCSLSNCADGQSPDSGLIQATDGRFYGTTEHGGTYGSGTVFRIDPNGILTTLHNFCAERSCLDGLRPYAGLVQGTDGDFYGTTLYGGANNLGVIFRLTPDGALTCLYSFCSQANCADGQSPNAPLIQDTDGSFYGTTTFGGTGTACSIYGCGTIFRMSMGLGPFVETEPAGGKVGAAIKILGTNLTGATTVTFNGKPATFTVEASSVIRATVPAGASTGTVQVVTPGGTLSSNVPFRVAP